MLLVDKKQVTVKEVEKLLGISIPLDKIIKKPLFEINPALIYRDPANGPMATKSRTGMEFPAYFRTRLKDGTNVEIRYCTNRTPNVDTHGQTEIYTPKKVQFEGKAEFLGDDNDKAVYYYLHFYNKQSPFRQEGFEFFGKPFEYEFQNDVAKANEQIKLIQLRNEATTHAANLYGEEMMIIAKGMRIEGVEAMEPEMVKAALMQKANDQPSIYLDKAKSTVNHIEGLIFDAIDKGIFTLDIKSNSKRWLWAMGPKKDSLICELSNNVANPKDALIIHIQQTPGVVNEFLPTLIQTRSMMKADTNIKNELKGVDVLAMLKGEQQDNVDDHKDNFVTDGGQDNNDGSDGEGLFELPKTYAEAQALLAKEIGKKTPAIASELIKGIQSGEITFDNIEGFFELHR